MTRAEKEQSEIAAALADAEAAARDTGEAQFVVVDELRGRVFATRRNQMGYRVLETVRPSNKAECMGITA